MTEGERDAFVENDVLGNYNVGSFALFGRKAKSRRKRVKRARHRKSKRKARKRKHKRRKSYSRRSSKIKYTKRGQPYKIMPNGRARFLKK